jgi:hypothetical protein
VLVFQAKVRMAKRKHTLVERFPPSDPCDCAVCLAYCQRPGWWTVAQAERALAAGYAGRMMLELSPERRFGVLSPAFGGDEGGYATREHAVNGCNFLRGGLCELHGGEHLPLECRFCHHTRVGLGPKCHAALEREWDSPAGQTLVARWLALRGLPWLGLPAVMNQGANGAVV